jgi:uncharacterized protein YjgD (DUF1641 family)
MGHAIGRQKLTGLQISKIFDKIYAFVTKDKIKYSLQDLSADEFVKILIKDMKQVCSMLLET